MKRYDAQGASYEEGCLTDYEEARVIEVDRDIKAANLQLLVEKVLAYESFAAQFVDGPPYDDAGKDADNMWDQLLDLARSIKQ